MPINQQTNHISEVYNEDSKRINKNFTLNDFDMSKGLEYGQKQRICGNRILDGETS